MLSNCACGSPVEIEAGEDGGLSIYCNICHATATTLSSDVDAFTIEWNQSVDDSKNSWMALVDSMKEWN